MVIFILPFTQSLNNFSFSKTYSAKEFLVLQNVLKLSWKTTDVCWVGYPWLTQVIQTSIQKHCQTSKMEPFAKKSITIHIKLATYA